MTANTDRVRHAVARSTGATTLARKDGDQWRVLCLNHGAMTQPTASRTEAWKLASHPQDWCSTCENIAKGEADKVSEGRLEMPFKPVKTPAKRTTRPRKS